MVPHQLRCAIVQILMPAQIWGDAKASDAEGAEFSLGSCTGLGNPQMLVEHLFQEKLDANMSNVKACEMISQTLLQICTDPAPPCAALCSTSVCCMLLNAHTALSGGEFFKGEWVYSTKSSPAEHHQIIATLDNQLILCYLCFSKGYISKPWMYALEKLTIHSAQAV